MFKLQSPSKYSPFDAKHLSRHCFHCSRQLSNSSIWCLIVLLPLVVSLLPHWQNISPWGLFSSRKTNKKKVAQGEIRWIRRLGHGGVMTFLVKNCWILSAVWAGVLINHPSWNEQTCWKSIQKNHWRWMQPLTTTPVGTVIEMGS